MVATAASDVPLRRSARKISEIGSLSVWLPYAPDRLARV